MELILDKLGRIDHAELEIRPLTVFVGENNTNKTWAAYCLYGLARGLAWDWGSPAGDDDGGARVPLTSPASAAHMIEAAAGKLAKRMTTGHEATSFVVSRRKLIGKINTDVDFSLSAEVIADLLRLPHTIPFNGSATLRLSREEFAASESKAYLRIDQKRRSVRIKFMQLPPPHQTITYQFRADPEDADSLYTYVYEAMSSAARRCFGPAFIFALPAERKTLVATYKLLRRGFEEVMSRPVVEFAHRLNESENIPRTSHEPGFAQALRYLHGVVGGSFAYESAGAGVRLEYAPTGSTDISLPMSVTSSLVRSLAGLDVYLRYWAHPGDLLIIDEPEMNAHPEAQLRITELLALLVNQGIRVVLTTHSPYVLDHIGTLVEASRLEGDARTRIVPKLRLRDDGALLTPEQLAVYRFDLDGGVTSIFDPETRSLDPSTFSDVGDAETNLFSDVLAAERRRGN